ncbi:hypothetical protein AXG93_1275s1080 [Marchantia polymorpha subsp. ruderalis]|uniref:Maf-like protein n=1 Tax=Marchantia polymorpha subsp. ruderalis TaxID=1480154 RepID=A0A176VM59_MARPO|nr:hypothetical protein AXG93_1275s1080 [Marchantia polymorpha subsp. ruderalis]
MPPTEGRSVSVASSVADDSSRQSRDPRLMDPVVPSRNLKAAKSEEIEGVENGGLYRLYDCRAVVNLEGNLPTAQAFCPEPGTSFGNGQNIPNELVSKVSLVLRVRPPFFLLGLGSPSSRVQQVRFVRLVRFKAELYLKKMVIQHLPLLSKKYIVLASASPRRAELIQGLGLKAAILPSTFAENLDISSFPCPGDYAVATAKEKALEVSKKVQNGILADLVIGADTVVELDGSVLEKPADVKDAFRMLSSLSDPVSGRQPLVRAFWEETQVEFAKLENEAISAYIDSGEPMDKAGGYGIQGIGGSFVKGIQGCYFNVMGFPVHRFSEEVDSLIKAGHFDHVSEHIEA